MRFLLAVVTALGCLASALGIKGITKTTAHRIQEYNYPAEIHTVVTVDNYVLTLFRIPYSPKLQNQNQTKPVAFLQHGFLSSSDCWILNGPDNALAYLLADAGYDVWLANSRGNVYSRNNLNIPPIKPQFWDFSWHEIALRDLPVMLDYVLAVSGEECLYYVGHSQGTTIFFVLMSSVPRYNAKIKMGFMLAPVAYMENLKSPLIRVLAPIVGQPALINELIGSTELLPSKKLLEIIEPKICAEKSKFQKFCSNAFFLLAGFDSVYLNYTLLPDIVATHPAGSSIFQGLHYAQEVKSGYFRQYDFGKLRNNLRYSSNAPPVYIEKNVVAPVRLYYGENDWLAAVADVQRLASLLPNVVELHRMPFPQWNHIDFLWSLPVKELLNDRIILAANEYEQAIRLAEEAALNAEMPAEATNGETGGGEEETINEQTENKEEGAGPAGYAEREEANEETWQIDERDNNKMNGGTETAKGPNQKLLHKVELVN